jgi:hypothetical protein
MLPGGIAFEFSFLKSHNTKKRCAESEKLKEPTSTGSAATKNDADSREKTSTTTRDRFPWGRTQKEEVKVDFVSKGTQMLP